MSYYSAYINVELRQMLKVRGLRHYGNKAELVARLTAYDVDHPFRFLALPGEIRNEIYNYVAAFEAPLKKSKVNKSRDLPQSIPTVETNNHDSIQQPPFFHTCSQIYNESRLLFYRYHRFKLGISQEEEGGFMSKIVTWLRLSRHRTSMQRLQRWLDVVGPDAQKQIRALDIDMCYDDRLAVTTFTRFVDDLHGRLTDSATVVYRAYTHSDVAVLRVSGKVLHDRNPARLPHYPGWIIVEDPWHEWAVPINELPSVPNGRRVWAVATNQILPNSARRPVESPSLTFGAGLGWFGRGSGTFSV